MEAKFRKVTKTRNLGREHNVVYYASIMYCECMLILPYRSRFMRRTDRERNGISSFPKLYYPELYLLNRGYKAFQLPSKLLNASVLSSI